MRLDRLQWYWWRARVMSPAEVATRSVQAVERRLDWVAVRHGRPGPKGCDAEVSPTNVRASAQLVGRDEIEFARRWAPGLEPVADRILAGRFEHLGHEYDLGAVIDWHRDWSSGQTLPPVFGPTMAYRFGDGFSAKHVWELNRHQHFAVLAKAYRLIGKQAYLDVLLNQWSSWLGANPYLMGINWASPIEASLRLVSWAYAWHLLGAGTFPPELRRDILQSVRHHATFICRYRSPGSSANNHRLAEAVGLLIAGHAFPLGRGEAHWRKVGAKDFADRCLALFDADGSYVEQASAYQMFALELALVGAAVIGSAGGSLSPAVAERIQAAGTSLLALTDAGGHLPEIGDDDSGRALAIEHGSDFSRPLSIISSIAAMFRSRSLAEACGPVDERTLWLAGANAAQWLEATRPHGQIRRIEDAECGGLFMFRWLYRSQVVELSFDTGHFGFGPIYAHAHADALAFTLAVNGDRILIDPGTYTYHDMPLWRGYFKGTSAHNTVTVDGLDQARSIGPTFWVEPPMTRIVSYFSDQRSARISAEHDGYRRLGVTHRRTLSIDRISSSVTVTDELLGGRDHLIDVRLHIAGHATTEPCGPRAVRCMARFVQVRIDVDPTLRAAIHQASVSPMGGWQSPVFGHLEEASTLSMSSRRTLPCTLVTRVRLLPLGPSASAG